MSLDQVAMFIAVVEEGGFAAGGRRLAIPKSTISRQIASLEERLGVQLLARTTRKVRTTEAGQRFYEDARAGVLRIQDAERAARNTREAPTGTLRLASIPTSDAFRLTDLVDRYLATWPEMSVEVVREARTVDLVREGFDLAIRTGTLDDSSLIAVRLASFEVVLAASPRYLAGRPAPRAPQQLSEHRCVLFHPETVTAGAVWTLRRGEQEVEVPVGGRASVSGMSAAVSMARRGHGIVAAPRPFLAHRFETGDLIPVLPGWSRARIPMYAVYAGGRLLETKTRLFLDMLKEHFAAVLPSGS